MPVSSNPENRYREVQDTVNRYKTVAKDTTGTEVFAGKLRQAEIQTLMRSSEGFRTVVRALAEKAQRIETLSNQLIALIQKRNSGATLTPAEIASARSAGAELKQVFTEQYTNIAERIYQLEEQEVRILAEQTTLQGREAFGEDLSAELASVQAQLDLLSEERAALQEFFAAFSGGDLKDALQVAQDVRDARQQAEVLRAQAEEDAKRKEGEVNWTNYAFFINFYVSARDVTGYKEFFDFANLGPLDPNDRESQKRVKEAIEAGLRNPETRRRIYFDIVTVLLMTVNHKIDDNAVAQSGPLRLPSSAPDHKKHFYDPRVSGQSPLEYDDMKTRFPEELRDVVEFFRAKVIDISYDDAVAHKYSSLYSSTKVGNDEVKKSLVDSELYADVTADYISEGRFTQGKLKDDEALRDKVWYMSTLLSEAMSIYDRAADYYTEKGATESLIVEGIKITNAIPFINKEPKEMFEDIYVAVGTKLLRLLFSQNMYDKYAPAGYENHTFAQIYALNKEERRAVIKALPEGLRVQVDLAVRQSFLVHRGLLNEPAKDRSAVQFEMSESFEPVLYYGSGKTLSAGGSSKKVADDGQRLVRSYLVPPGEFVHALAVIPKEAIVTTIPKDTDHTQTRDLDIYDYIDYLKSIYGEDLSKSSEWRTFLGQFSYRHFYDNNGNINLNEVNRQVVFFKTHPKFRRIPVDGNLNDAQTLRAALKEQPVHFASRRNLQGFEDPQSNHVGVHMSYNDLAFRLDLKEHYEENGVVVPTVKWDLTTENPQANYGRFWESSMVWQSLLDVTSEKPLVNVDVIDVPVERRRNLSQRTSEWQRRFRNKFQGNFEMFRKGIPRNRRDFDIPELRKQADRARAAGNLAQAAEFEERIQTVASTLEDYRNYEDQIDAMLYVDMSEISEQDYKVTFAASKTFEAGIHYLLEAIKTAKARGELVHENGVDQVETGGKKNMDLIHNMFRDVMDGLDSKGYFIPPELNRWVEIYENADSETEAGKKEEKLAEMAIKLELQLLQFMLYLNRYVFDETKTGDLRFFKVANVETKSGKPPLTITQRYKFTYLVAKFIEDVILDKYGGGDHAKLEEFYTKAGARLAQEFSGRPLEGYFQTNGAYNEGHIVGRMYQIYQRLGLYGSPESAILAMKFAETQLTKLPHPADIENIDVDDKGRVVEKRQRFLDFSDRSS